MRRRHVLATAGLPRFGAAVAALALIVCGTTVPVRAQPSVPARTEATRNHAAARPEVFLEVPLGQYTPDVVFPFGGSHHQVPGVVTVNRAPYYCVPHKRAFRERADFVVHLRTHHGLTDEEIRRVVLVDRGQVRYVGN